MKTYTRRSLISRNSRFLKRIRNSILFIILLLLPQTTSLAQTSDEPLDPLAGGRSAGTSDEILFIWADYTGTGGGYFHNKFYDYTSFNNPDINNEITVRSKDSIPGQMDSKEFLDAFAEDIDGDGFEEIVETWSGTEDQPIQIVIRQIDSTDYSFIQVDGTGVLEEDETISNNTLIRLVPGNFDNDVEKEFILAYVNEDSVKIILYDTDGTLMPVRKNSVQDEVIYLNNNAINYDITTGDFDGDGTDEIVLVGGERTQVYDPSVEDLVNRESMFVKLYDVLINDGYEIQARTRKGEIEMVNEMMVGKKINYRLNGIRIASVDFDNNAIDDIVIGYQVFDNSTYFALQALRPHTNLDSIQINDSVMYIHQEVLDDRGGSMTITAADMTGDGKEELIFAAWNKLAVYGADNDLILTSLAEIGGINVAGSNSGDSYHRTMTVTDLDAETGQDKWRNEIVLFDKQNVGEFSETKIEIRVYESRVDYTGKLNLKYRAALTDYDVTMNSDSPVAIITGNFDRDGMILGTPRKYRETGVFQPLIVLNAPPVHFDVLDNAPYDISGCFTGGDCDFIATYEEGLSQTEQITTQLNSDWGIDSKVYFDYEVAGNKLNTYLTANYGKNFSNVEKSSQTVTVGVQVQAIHDDLIYATVSDYTIWEYPVYNNNEFQGYLTTIVPELTENRWFPSKSWSGNAYMPEHEAGNIMSYPDYSEFSEITSGNEIIKGLENNNYSLGPSTAYEWRLEFSDFQENSASQTEKIGVEVGLDAAIGQAGTVTASGTPAGVGVSQSINYKVQLGLSVVGNYNTESFSSHTTTVKKDLLLKVNMGATTSSETGYQVTPFAYWSESGAMVIDYAVDVEQAAQGYTDTWWQKEYGTKPDPALILPWRLDPEKGYGLISDLKRKQTKDIVILPKDPQPGDTILVYARIHNFSLLPTDNPVGISFYLGDPDNGGELVESNDGETYWTSEDVIAARDYQWMHFEWIMPEYGRLFAVLDPDNTMDEIHENNNTGWIALSPVLDDDYLTGTESSLLTHNTLNPEIISISNYPNPFNSSTVISYSLDKGQHAYIQITDLSGRNIFMQNEGFKPAGEHQFEFNGALLPEGIYILTLKLESGTVFTNKMMVVN